MKRVAICGGAGGLGRLLSEKLRDTHHITIYDRKYPDGWGLPGAQLAAHAYNIYDLVNNPDYYANFQWNQFELVLQIAQPAHDASLSTALIESLKVNLNVLEACRVAGVPTVATVLDPRRDTTAVIERLYHAYKHDYRMGIATTWSYRRDESTADLMLKALERLDTTVPHHVV
jgi:hypothetical protein